MVKSNVKIKIAFFTNCYTGIIILTFLVAGNLASAGINSRFLCALTAFMTVVNIALCIDCLHDLSILQQCESIILLMS